MTSSSSDRRPGEFALIAELFAPLAKSRYAFGLKDDAAILPVKAGTDIVLTTDAVVEGVHFLSSDPADTVARKALRVNLSDLAAKGAKPVGYVMALGLPRATGMKWLRAFARGLEADQQQFGITLLGGDTTATPGPLSVAITAFGRVARNQMIRRDGARPGDLVFVTGAIGDAGGGLAILKGESKDVRRTVRDHLVHRYRLPQPRTTIGPLLVGVASAALDVSDGLLADLGHIAETSAVRIAVDGPAVLRSASLHALWGDSEKALVRALTAGDDYEMAFTAPPRAEGRVMAAAARSGVPVSRIGRVQKGSGVELLGLNGASLAIPKSGWTHF